MNLYAETALIALAGVGTITIAAKLHDTIRFFRTKMYPEVTSSPFPPCQHFAERDRFEPVNTHRETDIPAFLKSGYDMPVRSIFVGDNEIKLENVRLAYPDIGEPVRSIPTRTKRDPTSPSGEITVPIDADTLRGYGVPLPSWVIPADADPIPSLMQKREPTFQHHLRPEDYTPFGGVGSAGDKGEPLKQVPPNMGSEAVPYAGPNYVSDEDLAEEMKGVTQWFADPCKEMPDLIFNKPPLDPSAFKDTENLAWEYEFGRVAADGSIWTAPDERIASGAVRLHWSEMNKARHFGWKYDMDAATPGYVWVRRELGA